MHHAQPRTAIACLPAPGTWAELDAPRPRAQRHASRLGRCTARRVTRHAAGGAQRRRVSLCKGGFVERGRAAGRAATRTVGVQRRHWPTDRLSRSSASRKAPPRSSPLPLDEATRSPFARWLAVRAGVDVTRPMPGVSLPLSEARQRGQSSLGHWLSHQTAGSSAKGRSAFLGGLDSKPGDRLLGAMTYTLGRCASAQHLPSPRDHEAPGRSHAKSRIERVAALSVAAIMRACAYPRQPHIAEGRVIVLSWRDVDFPGVLLAGILAGYVVRGAWCSPTYTST